MKNSDAQLIQNFREQLSRRASNLLTRLNASEERELVYDCGGGWWLGDNRVAGCDVTELLRAALVKVEIGDFSGYTVLVPTSDAR